MTLGSAFTTVHFGLAHPLFVMPGNGCNLSLNFSCRILCCERYVSRHSLMTDEGNRRLTERRRHPELHNSLVLTIEPCCRYIPLAKIVTLTASERCKLECKTCQSHGWKVVVVFLFSEVTLWLVVCS